LQNFLLIIQQEIANTQLLGITISDKKINDYMLDPSGKLRRTDWNMYHTLTEAAPAEESKTIRELYGMLTGLKDISKGEPGVNELQAIYNQCIAASESDGQLKKLIDSVFVYLLVDNYESSLPNLYRLHENQTININRVIALVKDATVRELFDVIQNNISSAEATTKTEFEKKWSINLLAMKLFLEARLTLLQLEKNQPSLTNQEKELAVLTMLATFSKSKQLQYTTGFDTSQLLEELSKVPSQGSSFLKNLGEVTTLVQKGQGLGDPSLIFPSENTLSRFCRQVLADILTDRYSFDRIMTKVLQQAKANTGAV
jgi:hypothetical protein